MAPIIFGGYPSFFYTQSGKEFKITKLNNFILRYPLLSYLKEIYYYRFSKFSQRAYFLRDHIIKSKELIDKHYKKNIPFYILVYEANQEIIFISEELRQNNIKLLYYEEITKIQPTNKEITLSKDDMHPNAKAWKILIPKLKDYIQNYNKYEKQIKAYEEKHWGYNNTEFIQDWQKEISEKYTPSGFSLCTQDDILIKNKRINKLQAISAYTFWCFGNLAENMHANILAKVFVKISIKINKYNTSYNQYYNRLN